MNIWLLLMLLVYTFACLFLIFVILIQSGKGGGLSSLGQASGGITDTLGATGAEKALNKMTTWCAVGFMLLAILISLVGSRSLKEPTIIGEEGPMPELPITGSPDTSTASSSASEVDVAPVTPAELPATEPPAAEAPTAEPAAPAPAAPESPAPAEGQ